MALVSREEALAVAYVESLYERQLSQRNITKRTHTLRAFLSWCKANKIEPLAATHEQLQGFLGRKMRVDSRLWSPDKQRDDIKCLRAWYYWMLDRNIVRENPATGLHVVEKFPSGGGPDGFRWLPTVPESFRKSLTRENDVG